MPVWRSGKPWSEAIGSTKHLLTVRWAVTQVLLLPVRITWWCFRDLYLR